MLVGRVFIDSAVMLVFTAFAVARGSCSCLVCCTWCLVVCGSNVGVSGLIVFVF